MARPKEAILSRNIIRDQALAIIDEDGLDALTMRKLATRLGVQAASLYSHFPNKDAVLTAIADRLAKRIDPTSFDESWQDGLRTWANSFYSAMHWHPKAAPVVASGSLDHLSGSAEVHAGLLRHGWPDREATMVTAATTFLVLGAATTASGDQLSDTASHSTGALDVFADTIERASFTLALDALIRGFEPVHDSMGVVRSA